MTFPADAYKSCPPLTRCRDPFLQQGLEAAVASLDLDAAVQSKNLCVALADITDPSSPRLAALNGNQMMYAASLPKIAILLGAFERIHRGEMTLDQETHDTITRMIRNSSNEAATEMLNRVGPEFLESVLRSPKYRFYDLSQNGGLWVGKEYGKSAAWKRDPLYNLSHGATAVQVARFYYMLENGLLVSPEMSRKMKEILGHPAIHHKFVKGLEATRPNSAIYRKSGTWGQFHADSAIVERKGRRYIAVALANSPEGGQWLSDLIVALDDLIFHGWPQTRYFRPEKDTLNVARLETDVPKIIRPETNLQKPARQKAVQKATRLKAVQKTKRLKTVQKAKRLKTVQKATRLKAVQKAKHLKTVQKEKSLKNDRKKHGKTPKASGSVSQVSGARQQSSS
ncbi:MAG: serine hydrolase [Desulfococcaceae bacterium]